MPAPLFLDNAVSAIGRLLIPLLVVGGIFSAGAYVGWDKRGDREAKKTLAAQHKAEAIRRAVEDSWQKAHWNLAYEAEEKRAEREKQVASDIAGLRDGSIRVRDRFTCPKTPGSPAGSEPDREEAGLLQSDALFLLHFAAEADAIADERNQCIASYNALRAQ